MKKVWSSIDVAQQELVNLGKPAVLLQEVVTYHSGGVLRLLLI